MDTSTSEEDNVVLSPAQKVLATPELLEMIIENMEFSDVKNCRLVCRVWRKAARQQIFSRGILEIGKSTKNGSCAAKTIKSVDPSEYRQFTMSKQISKTFENHFGRTITTLHLKDFCFGSLNEARRLLFQAFWAMKELSLRDCMLSKIAKEVPIIDLNVSSVPSVTKLSIDITKTKFDSRVGINFFRHFSFEEIAKNYSKTLKELHCQKLKHERWESPFNFFPHLTTHQIRLNYLTYPFVWWEQEWGLQDSARAYTTQFGEELMDVKLVTCDVNYFLELFQGVQISKLKRIHSPYNDWCRWRGDKFISLKEVTLGTDFLNSFGFLPKMPALETLRIAQMVKIPFIGPYVGLNIHTLQLDVCYTHKYMACLGRVFPNVKRLDLRTLHEHRQDETQCALEVVSLLWPGLERLQLSGKIDECLRSGQTSVGSSRNGTGNENLPLLKNLLKMQELKTFIHDDLHAENVYYGDRSATEVFLKMPHLSNLRIRACSMSDDVLEQLRKEMNVLTYSVRV